METRQRTHHAQEQQRTNPSGSGAPSADLSGPREDAQGFYEVSRAAIVRGLSGNSQAFLDANLQQGGQ